MGNTKKCPKCRTEIDKKATICPNCKSDLRSFFSKHPILSIFIVMFIFGYFGYNYDPNQSTELAPTGSCPSDIKEQIKKYYKSPSTVEFISCQYSKDGNNYTFVGDTDSQNGFGAIVRSSFVCKSGDVDECKIFQK